ncbi:MAG: sodium:proton antiporter [Caulobacteraceae bacterium]|nr:sodium:proton antiporter [Caulobacteraceae bacterium]
MAQHMLEIAAALLAATALAAWLNARVVRLPVAVGLLVIGVLAVVAVRLVDLLQPASGASAILADLLSFVDYPKLVLNFLLAYLLFAGAMNVDLKALRRRGWATAILATVGTVLTAGLIAGGFYLAAQAAGFGVSPLWAVVFGVLVSPTDPIAVLAMTKRTDLDPEVRAQLEGEALFNDGVAVVLFRAALALAVGQAAADPAAGVSVDVLSLVEHVGVEALGGALVGLAGGVLAVMVIGAARDWMTETLVTVVCATAVYAFAMHFELSGPIGVVVAGLVVGSPWSEARMSAEARHYIRPFWHFVDEGMNAVLFLLAGLMALQLDPARTPWLLVVAAPLLVLAARWLAIGGPAALLPLIRRKASLTLVSVLTWAGVRGGLSLAMALSLPEGEERQIILAATFGVVLFSIVVQSMTMEGLAIRTGYGVKKAQPDATH